MGGMADLRRICPQHPSATGAPLQCHQRHSPIMKHRLSSAPMVEQPVGGRPSRNRKRPTDHVGAYPRARAFPAVPPSPPLVMQRHRILSCDGEASRRVLVPQIDFTLLSPSGAEIRIFPHDRDSPTTFHPGRRPLPRTKNLLGRWKPRKEGRAFQNRLRISETGARNALPRPLEQSFSRLTMASAALIFDPVLQPQYSLSRKLSDNTDVVTERIRKTNLSLKQLL